MEAAKSIIDNARLLLIVMKICNTEQRVKYKEQSIHYTSFCNLRESKRVLKIVKCKVMNFKNNGKLSTFPTFITLSIQFVLSVPCLQWHVAFLQFMGKYHNHVKMHCYNNNSYCCAAWNRKSLNELINTRKELP